MKKSFEFTREEAIESCQDIVKPKFLKLQMPAADSIQKSLPELLQTSWSKLFEDVSLNEATLTTLFRSMFAGDDTFVDLMSLQLQSDVAMIFGSFANKSKHDKFVKLLVKILPDHVILKINGDETTNKDAEEDVKKAVAAAKRDGKKVIIVSKNMASRSFSIPEIDTVLLAYDGGSLATTMQKIPRAFTPGMTYENETKQQARVVTLSFDANRTEMDPIDMVLLAEANRFQDMANTENMAEVLRVIARCYNLWKNDPETGAQVEIVVDDYVNQLISASSLESMGAAIAVGAVAKHADMFVNSVTDKRSVVAIRDEKLIQADISQVKKHKDIEKEVTEKDPKEADELAEARRQLLKNIEYFVKNLDQVVALDGYEHDTISNIIDAVVANIELATEFEELFGLQSSQVKEMVDRKILPTHLINMTLEKML